jgi:hypothetical protein
MSGKLLLKLDAIPYLLAHHTADHFPFLANPANERARTTFYLTLARLLFMEEATGSFRAFMAPLGAVLEGVTRAAAGGGAGAGGGGAGGGGAAALRAAVPRDTVVGLFRDLRGVAAATNNRRTYGARSHNRVSLRRGENKNSTRLVLSAPLLSPPRPLSRAFPRALRLQACSSTGSTPRTSPPSWPASRPGRTPRRSPRRCSSSWPSSCSTRRSA